MNWKRNNFRRLLIYSFVGAFSGLILLVLLIPVGGFRDFIGFVDWFFASSVFGWIFILFREKNEGWKTKVFLMGTTTLLSIPWMVLFMLGLYLLWYFVTGMPYLAI